MKRLLSSFALPMIMAIGYSADAQTVPRTDIDEYMSSVIKRTSQTDRTWRKSDNMPSVMSPQQRIITSIDDYVGPTSSWGTVYTPDGVEWIYSSDYTFTQVNGITTIESADITIYNEKFEAYKTFTATFELQPGDVAVNYVQLSPLLTKKFFDTSDSYEVMVYVHAVTEDYSGNYYTQVYSLSTGKYLTTIPGNEIGAVNTAPDPWSERYTMVFMREEVVTSEDSYDYFLYFDVYSRASWGGGCTLEHTFKVDYSYISGAGSNALPILINKRDKDIFYALPRYEKPYFVSNYSEEVTPDNHFIIDLYDSSFNLVKTTSIPMETEAGAVFSFPGLGNLNGYEDLTFDLYGEGPDPMYVIGIENYVSSIDDYLTSFYVYDTDGNKMTTLVEDARDYLYMSDIDGQEQQYCFYYDGDDDLGYFKFVNLPSGEEGAILDVKMEDTNITTSIDRVPVGASYQYVSSVATADLDADGNVVHKIVWFDADGSVNRIDAIKLGDDVAMAQPYISSHALNPYLYNTTSNYEYMFLVKEYEDISVTTRTKESFRVYDDQSNILLDLGPDASGDKYLSSIFLQNTESVNPNLVVTYSGTNGYTIHHIKLPLAKFNGGSGTQADPYVIASAGDLQAIQSAPGAYYVLANDIDMNNNVWKGNQCVFSGQLDGCGHTVTNLNLKGSGIFSEMTAKATVKNINFDGVTFNPEGESGILAGSINGGESAKSAPVVSNVHFRNVDVFSGDTDVTFGCVAGYTTLFTTIDNCSVTDLTVSAPYGTVGGIAGEINTSTSITNCLVDGTISANIAGGIAGSSIKGDEVVSNCHVHADIIGVEEAGGIISHSGRSVIKNCFVDGTVGAYGSDKAYAGGIVAYLTATYAAVTSMVISDCIVNADITVNPFAPQAIAHRIAGFTSGDEMLVNWESTDPNVDWSDPSTYPYVQGSPEHAIDGNFAIDMTVIDMTVADSTNSTEGKTISMDELTEEFVTAHGWSLGTEESAPWKLAGKGLAFYTEDLTLTTDREQMTVSGVDDYEWTVTCGSRYGADIKFEMSQAEVGQIVDVTVSADGKSATCHFSVNTDDGYLTATLGKDAVSCKINHEATGIEDVESSMPSIAYDGSCVISAGADISVYNVAGILVAEGHDKVSVTHLPAGAYVAVSGKMTYKFSK